MSNLVFAHDQRFPSFYNRISLNINTALQSAFPSFELSIAFVAFYPLLIPLQKRELFFLSYQSWQPWCSSYLVAGVQRKRFYWLVGALTTGYYLMSSKRLHYPAVPYLQI